MKPYLDCIPCFQRQVLQAARFVSTDAVVQERILRRAIEKLGKMDWAVSRTRMAEAVHAIVKEESGHPDPYREVKRKSNEMVLSRYEHFKAIIDASTDPLETAVRLSLAGNIIDYGIGIRFDLDSTVERGLREKLAIDNFKVLREKLASAATIFFITDNAGEIVFDRLLLETILRLFKVGGKKKQITLAVKGAPIINDATEEDAREAGLDSIPGLKFFNVGTGAAGSGPCRDEKKFLDNLDRYDLVISKGQGNFEALGQRTDIFFLLMAKCDHVARELGVPAGSFVVKCGKTDSEGPKSIRSLDPRVTTRKCKKGGS